MTGRYIPPALRAKTNQITHSSKDETKPTTPLGKPRRPSHVQRDLVSVEDIRAHFWPQSNDDLPKNILPLKGTLNASAANPTKLAYIVLFKDANPRWESEGIIFTKSNLNLLEPRQANDEATTLNSEEQQDTNATTSDPTQSADQPSTSTPSSPPTELQAEHSPETVANPTPIAVFAQDRGPLSGRSFQFIGWYKVAKLSFLEPRSTDLVQMLEQKWSRQDRRTGAVKQKERDASKWEESLGLRWAVMKMEKDEIADKRSGELVVERLPDMVEAGDVKQDGSRKTVNEMLAEMRLGES